MRRRARPMGRYSVSSSLVALLTRETGISDRKVIAKALGVSESSVSRLTRRRQLPTTNVFSLARQFLEKKQRLTPAVAAELEGLLETAAGQWPTRDRGDPWADIVAGRQVKFAVVESMPFAAGHGPEAPPSTFGFFDLVTTRALGLSAVASEGMKTRISEMENAVGGALQAGYPLLASPARMKSFSFASSPIRVRVTAVAPRACAAELYGLVQELLHAPADTALRALSGYRLVVDEKEIGETFVNSFLFRGSPQLQRRREPFLNAEKTLALLREEPQTPSVSFMNETRAAEVARRSDGEYVVVFGPWRDPTSLAESRLPSYALGWCFSVSHPEWSAQFERLLSEWLVADADLASTLCASLHREVVSLFRGTPILLADGSVGHAGETVAQSWADEVVGTGRIQSIGALPWLRVVREAASKLNRFLPTGREANTPVSPPKEGRQ